MQEAKKSRFPFTTYPTGWFAVGFCHELAPGVVKPVKYFGRDLVLFRTESGKAVVSDPYCPHLGAHLGYGGCVEGETIRCPFHHWKFDAEGKCVEVPFAPPPPRARINVWPTVERNDMILVWHDLAGRPPMWEMPQHEETEHAELRDFATFENIRAHAQEILENGADWLHFFTVHGTRRLVGEPEPYTTAGHVMAYRYETARDDPGTDPSLGHMKGEVWMYGPACARNINWGDMAPNVMVDDTVYPTPIDEESLQIRVMYRIVPPKDNQVPLGILKQIFGVVGPEIKRQLEQDFAIWANKAYLPRPMLAASDGPIVKYRKWYSQFYPEGTTEPEALIDKVA